MTTPAIAKKKNADRPSTDMNNRSLSSAAVLTAFGIQKLLCSSTGISARRSYQASTLSVPCALPVDEWKPNVPVVVNWRHVVLPAGAMRLTSDAVGSGATSRVPVPRSKRTTSLTSISVFARTPA